MKRNLSEQTTTDLDEVQVKYRYLAKPIAWYFGVVAVLAGIAFLIFRGLNSCSAEESLTCVSSDLFSSSSGDVSH
jgi:hypothetical protein